MSIALNDSTEIYLDHAATSPVSAAVADAMWPWLTGAAGNPASDHLPGRRAAAAVEAARAQVAALIGAEPREVIWTSGATESNNLALKGSLGFNPATRGHLLTVRTEHKSVIDSARQLERQGHRVSWLAVDPDGLIDAQQLEQACAEQDITLLSIMWVNNETGVIQDIPRIVDIARRHGVTLHVDASQAAGRLAIDLQSVPVDLLSLSAHKLGGPSGIGALFVRSAPRARVAAQMHGGGHERGLRSGTLAVHQCVGFGIACQRVIDDGLQHQAGIALLRDRLWSGINDLPEVYLNGHATQRAAAFLNVSFGRTEGESLLADLRFGEPAIAVSSGSACTSASSDPSYVLRALGRDDALARASIRFSLGAATSEAQIDQVTARVRQVVTRLRDMSPLWSASPAAASKSRAVA